MFNEDQRAYMDYLDKLAPQDKCYCGWYLRGKCPNGCPEDKDNLDKLYDEREKYRRWSYTASQQRNRALQRVQNLIRNRKNEETLAVLRSIEAELLKTQW